jgi:uncharacterized protein
LYFIIVSITISHWPGDRSRLTGRGEAMLWKKNLPVLMLALLLGVAAGVMLLRAERVEDVLNPRRATGSFVTDGAGILGPEYVRLIDAVCRDLQAKTTIELAVATVGDMGGLTGEEFADKLFRRFGIGAAGKDNGLLLLCSRDDRTVRLEVGYGLESVIPDARASALLENSGLPYLRQGLFGRGFFLAAREIARAVAAAQGVALVVAEPAPWPDQVVPPAPLSRPLPKKKPGWDPLLSSVYLAAGLLAFSLLGLAWTLLRFNKARGKAARAKAIGNGIVPTILVWSAGVIGFFLVLGFGKSFFPPLAAMLGAPGLATAAQLFTGRLLKKRLATYRLPCATCAAPMEMIDDSRDDQNLSAEEQAEEKAGGMDYEFWHCPKCGADEKLAVKLGKAAKCPKCGRRTLTSSTTTLTAATKEQEGRERVTDSCLNPKCNYSKTRELDTARLASPGTTPGSSSRPSSGSFGGGRSGGGGASKKF